MSHRKPSEKMKDGISPTLAIAIVGLISTVIAAYIGYLSNIKSAEITSGRDINPDDFITFLPIQDKDLRIKSFELEGSEPRINLRFVANKFDLDFDFSAPLDMHCRVLLFNLVNHFALDEHLKINMSQFPPYLDQWHRSWLLIHNGEEVSLCGSQTLGDMSMTNGDLINISIEWEGIVNAIPASMEVPTSIAVHPTQTSTLPVPTDPPPLPSLPSPVKPP